MTPNDLDLAIAYHVGYFARARQLLRRAQTAEEHEQACQWMENASDEITRWQAKLSEAARCVMT